MKHPIVLLFEIVLAILAAVGLYAVYKTYQEEIHEFAKKTHTRLTGMYFQVTEVQGPWIIGKLFGRKVDNSKVEVGVKKFKAADYQQTFQKVPVVGDTAFKEMLAMEA